MIDDVSQHFLPVLWILDQLSDNFIHTDQLNQRFDVKLRCLWRLQNGEIERYKPKVAVIWIGHVGPPVPSDDHEIFLTLVYAEIERRWNKTPPFEIESPNPKKKNGGREYQARCLEVLQWLHAEGDILSLKVSSEF